MISWDKTGDRFIKICLYFLRIKQNIVVFLFPLVNLLSSCCQLFTHNIISCIYNYNMYYVFVDSIVIDTCPLHHTHMLVLYMC